MENNIRCQHGGDDNKYSCMYQYISKNCKKYMHRLMVKSNLEILRVKWFELVFIAKCPVTPTPLLKL